MKSWIHEIAESYVAGHKPVRRDLKENYTSLTEKERFNLLSDNITSYFNEQIKNAYGFSLNDITQEQAGTLLKSLFEEGVGKYDGPAPDEGSTVVPEIESKDEKESDSDAAAAARAAGHREIDVDAVQHRGFGSDNTRTTISPEEHKALGREFAALKKSGFGSDKSNGR